MSCRRVTTAPKLLIVSSFLLYRLDYTQPNFSIKTFRLSLHPTQQIDALHAYLDLVKVTLPEWVLDFQHQQLPANTPMHQKLTSSSSKTTKQIQVSVLFNFSLPLKLRQNELNAFPTFRARNLLLNG